MIDELYSYLVGNGVKWHGKTPTKVELAETLDNMHRHLKDTGQSVCVGGLLVSNILPGTPGVFVYFGTYEKD